MRFRDIVSRVMSLGRVSPPVPDSRTLFVPMKQAGVYVTQETSLGTASVWACVRAISEPIASMPWRVVEEMPSGKKRQEPQSPVDWVLHREPNSEMTPFVFRETLVAWALTWGNGYAEIVRDRAGRIAELWPISPDRVEPSRTDAGELVYDIANANGPNTVLGQRDVFHLHGLGFDGLRGYSVIDMHRKTIAMGMAMNEAGISTFANSSTPAGIIKYAGSIDAKTAQQTRDEWNQLYSGPEHRGRVAVLGGEADFKPISIPLQDAQYIEGRQFQVEDICRVFRVPPHKVQHLLRSTNNNIEHQSIEFVQDTLMPWVIRLEQEANRKLFGRNQRNRYSTKINLNALLRGDSDARSQYYFQMSQMGVFSVNDIRELEDMGTIGPEGDKRFVQLNMTTLEKAGEEPEPEPEPVIEPDPEEEAETEDDENDS